jgi:MoxR-like ATPase
MVTRIVSSPHAKVMNLRSELQSKVLEREDVIDGALIALASRSNVFLLGKPGTAKSYLCELLCKAIDGANYFDFLMMKGTKLEELFGPLKLTKLATDQYVYNTQDRLPEAHIAFLDEIWKSSSAVLNALLKALNEHVFVNDGKACDMPLQTCFSASNELPEDASLDALYDRFHLRYEVSYIADEDNFEKLISMSDEPIQNRLSLGDLSLIQNEVSKIDISNVPEILKSLRQKFAQAGFEISDRRWRVAVKILKAAAWLAGHSSVEYDDIAKLEAIFWDKPEQRREIRKIVLAMANPDLQLALTILDEAQNVAEQAIKTAKELQEQGKKAYAVGGEANDKINELRQRLDRLVPSAKRDEIAAKIKSIGRDIQSKCLGI